MIATSSLGVIYVWKLPDSVTKLIGKKKIQMNLLEKIDEEELEDSMKNTKEGNKKSQAVTPASNSILEPHKDQLSPDLVTPNARLNFGGGQSNLPRWAQSVVGNSEIQDNSRNSKI